MGGFNIIVCVTSKFNHSVFIELVFTCNFYSYFRLTILKIFSGNLRLTNNGLQGSNFDFGMIWYRNSYCAVLYYFLHYDMAALLTNHHKSMIRKYFTNFFTGKDF